MGTAARPLKRAISTAVGIALVIGLAAPPVFAVDPAATSVDMTVNGTPEGGVPFTATVTLSQVDPPGPATAATGDVTVAEGATTLDSCTLVQRHLRRDAHAGVRRRPHPHRVVSG